MKFWIFYIGLISLMALACSEAQRPQSAPEEEYYTKIAYNVSFGKNANNYEVFTMDLYGKNRMNITNHPAIDWVYHSYKDKLYFLSDRDRASRDFNLYECDSRGQNLRKVSDIRLKDSWLSSRNKGREFVVTPHPSVDSAFYIIDAKGKILDKIYTGLPFFNDPCFSPDGNQIVFRGAFTEFREDANFQDELFIINVDGTELKQLTHYPPTDTTAQWNDYHAGPPQWNSDGTISYTSMQNGSYSIFTIPVSGGIPEQVTPNGFNQVWHNWSEDKSMLVFNGARVKGFKNYDIFLMEPAKRKISRLTFDSIYEQGPVFFKEKLSLKQ